jgi:hypothetical protein
MRRHRPTRDDKKKKKMPEQVGEINIIWGKIFICTVYIL